MSRDAEVETQTKRFIPKSTCSRPLPDIKRYCGIRLCPSPDPEHVYGFVLSTESLHRWANDFFEVTL